MTPEPIDETRVLHWEGCWNARDLGGLPLIAGGVTPARRVMRSDSPDRLTSAGWEAVWGHGVRTIVDLRREDESAADVVRPAGLTVHRVSWDDYPDEDWNSRNVLPGLPGSMRAFLADYPDAVADTARIVVDAEPGAVLLHCAGGRDRTGLIAIVLGAFVGVEPQALLADYVDSFARLLPYFRSIGRREEVDFMESEDGERRASVMAQAASVIGELDVAAAEKVLRVGGLTEAEIERLRGRLLGETSVP